MNARDIRYVEVTGHARQRIAGSFEIAIDRQASLSPDLTAVVSHRCNAILLSAPSGDGMRVFEMTPDQARQLASELVSAADAWTEPTAVDS